MSLSLCQIPAILLFYFQEIFGPIVTVYVYPDEKYHETAELANETSPYALTGAIYAEDQ